MFGDALNDRSFYFEPFQDSLQIVPFFKIYESSILGISQQVQYLHLKKLLESTL